MLTLTAAVMLASAPADGVAAFNKTLELATRTMDNQPPSPRREDGQLPEERRRG